MNRLAQLAQADFPPESVTETPTTTGTAYGEVYRSGHQPLTDPQQLHDVTDTVLGFASPIMTVEQVGANKLLQKLAKSSQPFYRRAIRYALRAANRVPDEGPQALGERGDAIVAAARVPGSKLHARLKEFTESDTITEILRQLEDIDKGGGAEHWAEGLERGAKQQATWKPAYRGEHKVMSGADKEMRGVMEELGIVGKKRYLKDFATRRELAKLGWKAKDLEAVPEHRIADILNHNIENTGQAGKWQAIEAGEADAARVSAAMDREHAKLAEHLDFVDFLRQHGENIEQQAYPLESASKPPRGPELYPLPKGEP